MQMLLSVAMLVSALVAVGESKAQTEVRASVDLSEWTPSQNLVLNLATGSYVITPPIVGWPKATPQPAQRRGRLARQSLRMMRALAKKAFKSGLTDKKCEARKGRGGDMVFGNAVGPMELTLTDGSIKLTSPQIGCRTEPANALFDYITRLFDHRSPWAAPP
ncbi:hypothetical protein [Sphingomonas sp. GB1N7]|uniref:hypothetical protein n=1 Tax=Parasphingomonas caseinilytica TaxID=3096158 RepID=UPI002FC81DEE